MATELETIICSRRGRGPGGWRRATWLLVVARARAGGRSLLGAMLFTRCVSLINSIKQAEHPILPEGGGGGGEAEAESEKI